MRTLEDFVEESNRIEEIFREPDSPQLAREIEATRRFVGLNRPSVGALEDFVAVCTGTQPRTAILRRRLGLNVRIGDYVPPPGGSEIEPALQALLDGMEPSNRSCFLTHLAYEALHPFTDGNGRSGRALWLWQVGGNAPLGFLHSFYYQVLGENSR